jgi:hypothetical protein
MSFKFVFPEPLPNEIVETPFMIEIMESVRKRQPTGYMSLWYGKTGVGKTTLAELLETKINEAFNKDRGNPNAYCAKHYQVSEIQEFSGNEQKQGIRSVYAAMGVTLSEGEYRFRQAHELADDLVETARRKRYKVFLLDEAGTLSIGAIRGIVTIRDRAVKVGWPICFIFIGMDDLPQKLETVPQIRRRVQPWVYFEQYDFDETWDLLSKLHPHFAALDKVNKEHLAQVKFIYDTLGGYPGLIVPFLNELDYNLKISQGVVDEKFLRTVHYLMTDPKDRALEEAKSQSKTRRPRAGPTGHRK